MTKEPTISINGKYLTEQQALALRVAATRMLDEMSQKGALGGDKTGEMIREGYVESLSRTVEFMLAARTK